MPKFLSLSAATLLLCSMTSFSSDDDFLSKASQSNIAEVDAAKLAVTKTSSPSVKKFANQMIADHSTAQNELVALAKKKGTNLPLEPDAEHKAIKEQLSALSGAAFDSTYMAAQVADHKVAVTLFSQESESGTDPDAKAYATKYLPKLKHHLMMSEMKHTGDMK